ncbi:MAG TPA: hypothetical protein VIK44_10035 [Acetobacterium sp.]
MIFKRFRGQVYETIKSARTQVTVHTEIELTRTGSIENSADALEV